MSPQRPMCVEDLVPSPWCYWEVGRANPPWTKTSETVNQNKPFLLVSPLSQVFSHNDEVNIVSNSDANRHRYIHLYTHDTNYFLGSHSKVAPLRVS
jgi:hypothetical protein